MCLPHRFVAISEKCVLNLKSGKFHIDLSFGLSQQCNGEKRKPLNVHCSNRAKQKKSAEGRGKAQITERPGWEGLQNKTEMIRYRGESTQRRKKELCVLLKERRLQIESISGDRSRTANDQRLKNIT